MASRGRRPLKPRAQFGGNEEVKGGVHDSILKQARKSGQLNLSGRSLTEGICLEQKIEGDNKELT